MEYYYSNSIYKYVYSASSDDDDDVAVKTKECAVKCSPTIFLVGRVKELDSAENRREGKCFSWLYVHIHT